MSVLGKFEGSPVLRTAIEIPRAGGGLNDPLKVDPRVFHKGDEVYVLIKGPVGKVRFDPVKDTDGVARVHVIGVEAATLVEPGDVEFLFERQERRLREAREAAEGITPLDDWAEPDHTAEKAKRAELGKPRKRAPRKKPGKAVDVTKARGGKAGGADG